MRVVSIVGARPQFIKAAPLSLVLRERHEEILVHTGQHFDREMSQVFFEELDIPIPDQNLGVTPGSHGRVTGQMLGLIEALLVEERPDWVLVYGDTNTTLAGALAAAKIGIRVVHVEAGLRSFNRAMPEEINRVVVDHVSTLLLCPTETAVANLRAEGIESGVALVGDLMLDAARIFAERVDSRAVLGRFGVSRKGYYLATVQRQSTADDPDALERVIKAFSRLDLPILWPVHPRTQKNLERFGIDVCALAPNISLTEPLSYLQTNALLRHARALITDSGGMQKEAYFFGVPCVTLRDETEWVETVRLGWNVLVGTDPDRIVAAATEAAPSRNRPPVYGDGYAAQRCVDELEKATKGLPYGAPLMGSSSGLRWRHE